ncbi:MAG: outer membrane lipoprotein-sorting protein [Chthoniobacterales bacterium]
MTLRPIAFLCLLPLLVLEVHAQSAEQILQAARLSPTARPASLQAQIRGEGQPTPLRIRLKNRVISYCFSNPDQTLLLKLDQNRTRLLEKKGDATNAVTGTHLHDEVRDSGVTYQDLSMGFLYWPLPILQGEETVKTRRAWKIDLQAPSDEPVYGVARVWIDKESGAILRIEGYDKKGLLLRRFEIISAQKIDGLWMLKQMRIESFEPGKPDPISRRYLEVLGKDSQG